MGRAPDGFVFSVMLHSSNLSTVDFFFFLSGNALSNTNGISNTWGKDSTYMTPISGLVVKIQVHVPFQCLTQRPKKKEKNADGEVLSATTNIERKVWQTRSWFLSRSLDVWNHGSENIEPKKWSNGDSTTQCRNVKYLLLLGIKTEKLKCQDKLFSFNSHAHVKEW